MCRDATVRAVTVAWWLAILCQYAPAQAEGIGWRHVGTSAIEAGLPGLATGPVDRVWYSEDGSALYARTAGGKVFQTKDFEQWRPVSDPKLIPPPELATSRNGMPEPFLKLGTRPATPSRLYGIGRNAYRSDDGGQSWLNLTSYKGRSILGAGLTAVAVSPSDADEVVVASNWGVWRSLDGGLTWNGLNDFLPDLPAGHLLGLPAGTHGIRMSVTPGYEIEWAPGEKTAWRLSSGLDVQREQDVKAALTQVLGRPVTAVATAKDYIYAGDSEGRLRVSADAGVTWGAPFRLGESGRVEAIWVDANDPRVAIAALGARPNGSISPAKAAYVLRTMNGGGFWDDITANLPETAAHGVAADRASGAVYVATDAGVFLTVADLGAAGRPSAWIALSEGLPAAPASDIKLDAGGNQVYVALEGYGVYAAIAPHRLREPRIVNAADYSSRAAAPGSLLSVIGARVESARSDDTVVPVLDATENASQIQVPFEARGAALSLSLDGADGRMTFGLPLQSVSPAIFVDPEGTPLIMDASSGVLLDAGKPAHGGARLQVLATGFGRVNPAWPTGLAAPLSDPPRVAATVHAYLDGAPVEVTQATLAPGYVGFYLIEIQLPRAVNTGASELFLEAEGQQSNRVRLYTQP